MQYLFVPVSGGSARRKSAAGYTVMHAPHHEAAPTKIAGALPVNGLAGRPMAALAGLGRRIAARAKRPSGIASRFEGRIAFCYMLRLRDASIRGMAE